MKLTISLYRPCHKRADYITEFEVHGVNTKFRGKNIRTIGIDYTEDIHEAFLVRLSDMGIIDKLPIFQEQTMIHYGKAIEYLIVLLQNRVMARENLELDFWTLYKQWEKILIKCIEWHGVITFSNNKIRRTKKDDTGTN